MAGIQELNGGLALAAGALLLGVCGYGFYRIKRRVVHRARQVAKKKKYPRTWHKPSIYDADPATTNAWMQQIPELVNYWEGMARLGISGRDNVDGTPMPGDEAPDFALRPLKPYRLHSGPTGSSPPESDGEFPRVRLSDFRGHQPVVLIFGSYT